MEFLNEKAVFKRLKEHIKSNVKNLQTRGVIYITFGLVGLLFVYSSLFGWIPFFLLAVAGGIYVYIFRSLEPLRENAGLDIETGLDGNIH